MEQNQKFSDYINARFIAWEGSIGKRGTVTDFATALGPGTHQGDVSHWMKGTRIPGVKIIQKLVNNSIMVEVTRIVDGTQQKVTEPLIGPEIWEAAGYGYLVKDPTLIRTLEALEQLPRPIQEYFATQAEIKAREHNEQTSERYSFQAAAS